jgi:A/G-specific adenine glycosylase
MILSTLAVKKFQRQILGYYRANGRKMPWRETDDPYRIFISEIMLQQTQVSRVEEKYRQFISAFPDFESLDKAPLSRIFAAWQGLGYNRRALNFKKAAHVVMTRHSGALPKTEDALRDLPGIGNATAGSIMAFAFDLPVVFIETNIRTVFIHFFFKKKENVSDREILPVVEKTLYKKSPRIWYWALMDYGSMLKKSGNDQNCRSVHYVKQSRFQGSRRQLRGLILKTLLSKGFVRAEVLAELSGQEKEKVDTILFEMKKEGFVAESKGKFGIRE